MVAALTIAEFYALGLRAEALISRARPVEDVIVGSSMLVIPRHGAASGTAGRLRAVSDASLPTPLVAGTTYYAIPSTGDAMQLSATDGGAAVTLLDPGDGRVEWVEDIEAKISSALDHWTGVWDEAKRGHTGPWTEYPRIARQVIAILAADQLLRTHGQMTPEARTDDQMLEQVRWARRELERQTSYIEGADATPAEPELGAEAFYAGDGTIEEGSAL